MVRHRIGDGPVQQFVIDDPAVWYRAGDVDMAFGDVVDSGNSDTMSAGFARYKTGAKNELTPAYDEVIIITKGVFAVHDGNGAHIARAGEIIFLRRGIKVVYEGIEDAELVYVTYPHWLDVT